MDQQSICSLNEHEQQSKGFQTIKNKNVQDQIPVTIQSPIQADMLFYNGKLRIYSQIILPKLEGDVLVNFCASDILSGDEIFLNVHENAGEELKNFCAQYQYLGIGCCRLSESFGLKNFKKILHCILPRPIQGDDLIDLDELVEYDLMLSYRNALDLTTENNCNSIVFTHPLLYADRYGLAKLAIAVLTYWLDHSPYADRLNFISIACPSEEIAQCYMEIINDVMNRGWEEFILSHSSALYTYLIEAFGVQTIGKLDVEQNQEEANAPTSLSKLRIEQLPEYDEALTDVRMLDTIFEREYAPIEYMEEQPITFNNFIYASQKRGKRMYPFDESEDPSAMISSVENQNMNQFCIERYGFDMMYIREHPDEVYDLLFRSPEGLQLQLSRNLSATILTIEEEFGGMFRQYRMTTQNKEGETLYFRCSRCESLMRYTNEEYRPKITVKDGFIYGDCYPVHHPQCYPVTKEWVILQQLERQARYFGLQTDINAYYGVVEPTPFQTEENTDIENLAMETSEIGANGILDVVGDYNNSSINYLTAQVESTNQFRHSANGLMMGEISLSSIKQEKEQPSPSALSRLRPDESSMKRRASSGRHLPISVVTPRYNLIQPTNPNEVPIIYKRKEAPENATLRAIRKCENELEGRVNEELDRALAAQENMEFWQNPHLRVGNYFGAQFAAVLPIKTRNRQRQNGLFMELGHEEVVIGDNQTSTQQEPFRIDKESDSQQLEEPINTSIGHKKSNHEQWSEQLPNTMPRGEVQIGDPDYNTILAPEQEKSMQGSSSNINKSRKFRVIRKRGAETNLAFDWRETDLNGIKTQNKN